MTSLGLNSDSIVCYRMGEVVRAHASEVPELLPCGYLVGDNNVIKIHLKGTEETLAPRFSVTEKCANISWITVIFYSCINPETLPPSMPPSLLFSSFQPFTLFASFSLRPSFFPPVLLPGVRENSIDGLVFDTLIPKPIIQRYLNLLMEHRRIILSGPSGTGKSFLAAKLAEYIISQTGQVVTEHNVARFNVDQNSSKVRRNREVASSVRVESVF